MARENLNDLAAFVAVARERLPLPHSLLARSLAEPSPKPVGVGDPSFGTCAGTKTEAVTDIFISVILDLRAGFAQSRDPPFHGRWRSDAIILADDDKRRRLVGRII